MMWENRYSFESFFKQHYQLGCLVAMRYLKNEQEAEDIVQETFVYLWQKRDELKLERNPKGYLLNAVKNRTLNFVNRTKKLDELSEKSLESLIDDDLNSDFSDEELAIQISQAIDALPAQCQKIFLLAYKDQLSYLEIASVLNLSKNTVKTQMGIAYKIIRFRLKEYFMSLFSIFRTIR